ncbi:MAG: methionyl-tRNA formyltransferase [Clostridia bacterium]|nr:methionyl-tRNA formyltransferase [Clostridia bacterium]
MKIMFMGTPDFAVASLRALVEGQAGEITVITQPDKPKGRKMILTPPEVKVYAENVNLPVYQPKTLRDEEFDAFLREKDPDIIIVAAYGKILPKSVIDYPKYGCINVHGSILPRYRGAAPVQRCLINGERETGNTIMYMDEGLDTGDIIAQSIVPISIDDNAETLFEKMSLDGAALLMKVLPNIVSGKITRKKQNDADATYAQKVGKEDCMIDFSMTAEEIHNRVRGLCPYLYAYAMRGQIQLKLVKTALVDRRTNHLSGTLVSEGNKLYVACQGGWLLEILEVLPAGKKQMKASDYLRGNPVQDGEKLVCAAQY